ncbi:MAG: ATP-binding protein [Spirochaetaceae bacterium]|nr:MAG: ATP-binding protein [Spirochaetaceae bacterium]
MRVDWIPRVYDNLLDHAPPGKIIVLYGPRQVGKTTLVRRLERSAGLSVRYTTGDDIRVHEVWGSRNLDLLREYVHGYDLIVIDEAQRVPEIGLSLKLLVDSQPACRIVVTGSASLELSGQIGEPLTGRKSTLTLYPVSQLELSKQLNRSELRERLGDYLVYGTYPEILTAPNAQSRVDLLNELTGSYLLKDILALERVKSAKVLLDLLRLLAYQVGSEVSLRELGGSLGIDYKTVARYVDLLEKAFVLYNVRGFSRNLRQEVTRQGKYYFYDNGVRNALIANFNRVENRNDIGSLWENFIFMERLKSASYSRLSRNVFFWRTWEQQEIDLIEERGGTLHAYEFKFRRRKTAVPSQWSQAYPTATFEVVDSGNYLDFLL